MHGDGTSILKRIYDISGFSSRCYPDLRSVQDLAHVGNVLRPMLKRSDSNRRARVLSRFEFGQAEHFGGAKLSFGIIPIQNNVMTTIEYNSC